MFSAGLVNGALGLIQDFVYDEGTNPPDDFPAAVMVRFDQYSGPTLNSAVPIPPITRSWTKGGKTCFRTQVPLLPAWGCTVHQAQGQTFDKVHPLGHF